MPLSRRLRAIFIHVPKTGGSSIEKALDLYPPDDPGGHKLNTSYLFGSCDRGHLQHTPYAELLVQGLIPDECRDYFKFAFVRNPWDRVVSEFFYAQSYQRHADIDFAAFVRDVVPVRSQHDQHYLPQVRFCDGLDFVGRFERLQQDFDIVCDRLSIPHKTLPHVRKREHLYYPDYYTTETREIISHVYQQDIETFGYTFERGRWGTRLERRVSSLARKVVRQLRRAQ